MMTFATLAAAAALSLLAQGMADTGDMKQATRYQCRPSATSTIASAPICKGSGPMEAQTACFCRGIYTLREEPACHRDGTPALFSSRHRLTKQENDKLVSCQDAARRRG